MKSPASRPCFRLLAGALALANSSAVLAQADDTRPLSAAQIALFETPHLQNVTEPETLLYTFRRDGPAGFDDTVALHIRRVNPDGSKDIGVDYLTGPHRVVYPELDHFRGNPLFMLALETDVGQMHAALGASASFFRNRIRESFVEEATATDTTATIKGRLVPARAIAVRPFAHVERLERIASVQAKTYTFLLADDVPGMIAEIRIDTPADAALHAPALSERITFGGTDP